MEKVMINEYHDYGGNLYNTLPEQVPASDVRAYKCVKCGTINLPTLGYNIPIEDRKLASKLLDVFDGKEVQEEFKGPKMRPAPGYAVAVPNEQEDPASRGYLVPKHQ